MTAMFTPFPKIARLHRKVIFTEKIDGTNGAVVITDDVPHGVGANEVSGPGIVINREDYGWDPVYVYAQSRNRIIPGVTAKAGDNSGFGGFVRDHARELAFSLGVGVHFGEWYGSGIQRGYGLTDGERYFALFNVARWTCGEEVPPDNDQDMYFPSPWSPLPNLPDHVTTVPVLGAAPSVTALGIAHIEDTELSFVPFIDLICLELKRHGSWATGAIGFDRPEGVITYHTAANLCFKTTLEKDEEHKG